MEGYEAILLMGVACCLIALFFYRPEGGKFGEPSLGVKAREFTVTERFGRYCDGLPFVDEDIAVELSRLNIPDRQAATSIDELRRKFSGNKQKLRQIDLALEFPAISELVEKHSSALILNLERAVKKNEYGAVVADNRQDEIDRFIESVEYRTKSLRYLEFQELILLKLDKIRNSQRERGFDPSSLPSNGIEFEHWVARNLQNFGWDTSVTQGSGDNGVDVVARKGGIGVAIQCKLYAGSVGNKAVQEIYAGMKHMRLDRAVVISTGQYTRAAKALAATTGVSLLSEHDIPDMENVLERLSS